MDQILLNDCDSEDVDYVMADIVKSLDIKFAKGETPLVKTFGEFCDVIYSKLPKKEVSDCTTQQSFYKLRNEICLLRNLDVMHVVPASRLDDLVPRKGRRKVMRRLKKNLGIPISLLTPKDWILVTIVLGLLAAVVELFFNCLYGLEGLGAAISALVIADTLGTEFRFGSLGEVAREMAFSHYAKSRRDSESFNREEVDSLIRKHFCEGLIIEPQVLTREAKF